MKHYVYLLECVDGSWYTGYTTDVERRLREHNGETAGAGAKYTAGRRPVKLLKQKSFATRSEAMSFEAKVKQQTKGEKLQLFT